MISSLIIWTQDHYFCVFLLSLPLYVEETFELINLSFLFFFNKYILITLAMPGTVLDINYFSGRQEETWILV